VLAGWEASDTGSMSTESDYDAVLLELHHRHLPVLDDAGIIEYDADNGAVTLEDFDDSARYQLADLVAPGDAGTDDRGRPAADGPQPVTVQVRLLRVR